MCFLYIDFKEWRAGYYVPNNELVSYGAVFTFNKVHFLPQ